MIDRKRMADWIEIIILSGEGGLELTDGGIETAKAIRDLIRTAPEEIQCPKCEGTGKIPIRENRVSREMASDAGEPDMAGLSLGFEWGQCPQCGGAGLLSAPPDSGPKMTLAELNSLVKGCVGEYGGVDCSDSELVRRLRSLGVKVEEADHD